jgi:hypothetical protein
MHNVHTPQKPITTRRFSAIDIENLALQPAVSPGAGRHIAYLLQDIFHLKPEDLAVVAGGPHNAFAIDAASKVLSGQSIWRGGHNGGDLALIEALDHIPSPSISSSTTPVNEVIIGSGDGIFTSVVSRLQNRGLVVTCVAYSRALHPALALAANRVIRLDQFNPIQQAA